MGYKSYVTRSPTVYKLLFCTRTPCINSGHKTKTFALVYSSELSSVRSNCFVHGQCQRTEEEHTTKTFSIFLKNSSLSTMLTIPQSIFLIPTSFPLQVARNCVQPELIGGLLKLSTSEIQHHLALGNQTSLFP